MTTMSHGPGLVDYVMIRIKELFIKNEKSNNYVLISWVNKIVPPILDIKDHDGLNFKTISIFETQSALTHKNNHIRLKIAKSLILRRQIIASSILGV